jgi:hypothetical protein
MSEVVSLMSLVRSSGIISLTPCGAANATAAEANARRAYNNFMILLVLWIRFSDRRHDELERQNSR